MDEIMRELTAIKAAVYTLLGFAVIQITAIYAFLSTVAKSGQGRVIPQLFNLTTRAVKRGVYALDVKLQKRRKLRNIGQTEVVPDVPQTLVVVMARWMLSQLETSVPAADIDLSESTWIRKGEWKELSGSTPEQWRAVMDRLEAAGIVERKGAKRTRVLSTAKRPSVVAKLKAYLGH